MFDYHKIVERKIKEAEMKGLFDNLPGQGKPLNFVDESNIPEDLRLAYKILKNANCLPPELDLKKEIRQMEDMLDNIPDEKEKYRQIKRINFKIMELNMLRPKTPMLEDDQIYYSKVLERFSSRK